MKKPAKTKRIIIALWTGNASGRDILSGVFRYAKEKKFWQTTLVLLPNGFSSTLADQIRRDGADGIITSDPTHPFVHELIHATKTPLAVIGPSIQLVRPADGKVAFIEREDMQIGELGARHFLSIGHFNSYGYVQDVNRSGTPPDGRENGFRQTLADAGLSCELFSRFRNPKAKSDLERLSFWLQSLPKPAAVMCFYDLTAIEVLNVCRKLGFSVPNQVSVLGVDNDEPVCETAMPPLSSLQPDHETMGYRAAMELDAMMNGRPIRKHRPKLQHRLVERDTTKPTAPSANLVRRAFDFIRQNAEKGIGVPDVVAALGVSRRLADLRFHEIEGRSIHKVIEEKRLEIAIQRLRGSDWSVTHIAAASGYSSLQAFEAAFKKQHGRSPLAYRSELRRKKNQGTKGHV